MIGDANVGPTYHTYNRGYRQQVATTPAGPAVVASDGYHDTVALFLAHLTDGRYGWADLPGSAGRQPEDPLLLRSSIVSPSWQ